MSDDQIRLETTPVRPADRVPCDNAGFACWSNSTASIRVDLSQIEATVGLPPSVYLCDACFQYFASHFCNGSIYSEGDTAVITAWEPESD